MRNLILLMLLLLGAQMSAQFKCVPISKWSKLKDEKAILVDVRTAEEFDQGHLCEALNVDFKAANFKAKIQKLPKEATIYLYCKTGVRSKGAASLMEQLGYKNLVNLKGGFTAFTKGGGVPCNLN